MLVQIAPEIYKEYVTYERGNKILYVQVLKAIYGMLQSALLFYMKIKNDLVSSGFEINPYDPCVANKVVKGSQMTVVWHEDDMKVSHGRKDVVDSFIEWIKKKYGQILEVKVKRGNEHTYLGMNLVFDEDNSVKIDMKKYVSEMINEYPDEVQGKSKTPANENCSRSMTEATN